MAEVVVCPHCGRKIEIAQAVTQQVEERLRREFDAQNRKAREAWEKEQQAVLEAERAKLARQAERKAKEAVSVELKDLKEQLSERDDQVHEAEKRELAARKRVRGLEERERTLKLEADRALEEERKKIWEKAQTTAEQEHRLKDREKDEKLEGMRRQIEVLKRKAEQGSQQAQGEAGELEVEQVLVASFRTDDISAVEKGRSGADVIQEARSPLGKPYGTILWESKRAQKWSDAWLQKLKDDQLAAKADVAVIVSNALPDGMNQIGHLNGIWCANFASVAALGTALRHMLVQVAEARCALVGKGEKMELIYEYLSGPEFRQRVEAIVEAFNGMKSDLENEKAAMQRIWARREKQIERIIHNTAALYGEIEGVTGAELPQLQVLELPAAPTNGKGRAQQERRQ